MSPLLHASRGPGKTIIDNTSKMGLYFYGPGSCSINHNFMSMVNYFCSLKDGILCPFAYKFTDGFNIFNNKNDM